MWNVFDELRMGTFVMDRNNLVFKQNLEIVFVPYMTCMKLFMEIDNFKKIGGSDISNSQFLLI